MILDRCDCCRFKDSCDIDTKNRAMAGHYCDFEEEEVND